MAPGARDHGRHYRPDQGARIAELERRRIAMRVPIPAMAARAGISEKTWWRMRRDGRAWARHLRAVAFALRSIARERRAEGEVLDADD